MVEDSRKRGYAFQFMLGSGQVIKGWDECIPRMSAGQHCIFTVPPECGYGDKVIHMPLPPLAVELGRRTHRLVATRHGTVEAFVTCRQVGRSVTMNGLT